MNDPRNWVQSGILGRRPEYSKKGHFLRRFTQICLKILFLQKRLILSNITRGSVRLPDAEFCWIITLGKRKIKYPTVYHGIVYFNLSSICQLKALKAFIKPFETPQRNVKMKI